MKSMSQKQDHTQNAKHTLFARSSPIIPKTSATRHTLVYVIAIMSFLACLTIGFVVTIENAASNWQSDVGREITIQIRPEEGVELADAVARAIELAKATPGIDEAYALGEGRTRSLLEPWLGAGIDLAALPVPKLIIVKAAAATPDDLAQLRSQLATQIRGASLDDHRQWQTRLAAMARTTTVLGFIVLLLVLTATVLSVVFATHGVVAGNRHVIEILHYVGADDRFIARQFQDQFLRLGLKAGLMGGGVSVVLFAIGGWLAGRSYATPAGDQLEALIGQFTIGMTGYGGIMAIVLLVAVLTALTSRLTVRRHLSTIYP